MDKNKKQILLFEIDLDVLFLKKNKIKPINMMVEFIIKLVPIVIYITQLNISNKIVPSK